MDRVIHRSSTICHGLAMDLAVLRPKCDSPIDLRSFSDQCEIMIWGSKITGVDTPPLASKLLVTNAYSQAQGGRRLAGKNPAVGEPEVPGADRTSVAARALKTEFLKSLHAQSNAGLVSIKDVAHALDHILKRDALK